MNKAIEPNPTGSEVNALCAFFGTECREFERGWHERDLSSGNTSVADYWEWVAQQIKSDRQSVDDVIRSAMMAVYVNADLRRIEAEHEEDEPAAGLYKVTFGKDVSGWPRARLATAALQIFGAANVVVSLDDFDIDPVDGAGHQIIPEEGHANGIFADYGTVEKVGDAFQAAPWIPTLYIEASTGSGFAQADWARVSLSPWFIDRISVLQKMCMANDVESARVVMAPTAWSGAAQWRPDNQALVVSGTEFWFTAQPKNHDSEVSTTPVPFATLTEILATGRDHDVNPSFGWRRGELYFHISDAEALIEKVEDQDENSGA